MKYQEFIETVKKHIQEKLNQDVTIYPVQKNNGRIYDGLVILDSTLNISPTIYLNPYFHRYLDGTPMEEIYDDILKIYQDNVPKGDFDISIFREYDKVKPRIIMKLINAQKNKHLLKKVPHILVYDLAIVFLCNVSDHMKEYATILIHNEHMDLWNITKEKLYELAQANSMKLLPPRLENLHDIYKQISDVSLSFLEDLNIYILTNSLKIHGATCMIYPNLLEEIANIYEDDLCLIPSSIHEILIIPYQNIPTNYSLNDIDTMIIDVNETELADDEILSDHSYIYHRDTKEITY